MIVETDKEPDSPAVAAPDWRAELRAAAASLANAPVFGVLIIAWVLVFHFLGNSTLGYINTPSLFAWMDYVYGISEDDSHGYIIPFVVIGLLWWKREELTRLPKGQWWPSLAILLASLGFHLVGLLVQQTRLSIVGFYLGLWGLVGVIWGRQVLRATFFPFCLLVFTVPIATLADTITFPLRHLATTITAAVSNTVLGINVQQQGTSLFDPSGRYSYEVAAACSGIRSLTAIFALTTVYAFVFFSRPWKRLLVLFLAFPLALISNVLRLLMIIVASEAFSAHAGHVVHESTWLSLVPYVVAFAGILLAGRLMKEDRPVDVLEVVIPVAMAIGIFMIPHELFKKADFSSIDGSLVFVVAVIAAAVAVFLRVPRAWRDISAGCWSAGLVALAFIGLSVGLLAERSASQRLSEPGVKVVPEEIYAVSPTNKVLAGTNIVYLPPSVLSYRSQPLPLSTVVYDWLPKDTTYGQRIYIAPDSFRIDNMVVLMGADRTSIHKPQFCITGQGFRIVSEETDHIPMTHPEPYDLPVKKLHFNGDVLIDGKRENKNGVFVYWFVSDRELTAEHGTRMWKMGYELIRTGVLTRWAYVIHIGYCPPGAEEEAFNRIKEFIRAAVPEYQLTAGASTSPRRMTDARRN